MRFAVLCFSMFFSFSVQAQIQIEQSWARATPPGAQVAGGYMTIRNAGAADKLLGASSPAAAKVELHVHINDNGVMKMREVAGGYAIPAQGALELKPGGAHLMFMDLKQPFKEGEKVPVKLKFEKAGEVSAEFQVGGMGASAAPMPMHGHKM